MKRLIFLFMMLSLNLIPSNSYTMENKDYSKFSAWVMGKPTNQIQNPKALEAISNNIAKPQETLANNRILSLSQENFYYLLDQSILHPDEKHTIKMWYLTPLSKRNKKTKKYLAFAEKDKNNLTFICHNQKFNEHRYCLEKLKRPYKRLFTPEGLNKR